MVVHSKWRRNASGLTKKSVRLMDLWAEEKIRSIFGCRREVVEYHCKLLPCWNSFAHRSVLSCYFMFNFTKYKSKCILCDTKILIPLFWGEGTVSHSKPVIGLRIRPEVSFPWRVNQCHHREREQQQFFLRQFRYLMKRSFFLDSSLMWYFISR